jgi:hypothetical protein
MVASSLMLMLMGLLMTAFNAVRLQFARTEAQLALDVEATTALSRLGADLAETRAAMVFSPNDQLLAFPLPRNAQGALTIEPTGELRWGVLVAYRALEVDGTTQLVRQVSDVTDSVGRPQEVSQLSPLPDLAWWNAEPGVRRKIATGFVSLLVVEDVAGPVANPQPTGALNLTLHLRQSAAGRTYGVKLQSSITPRN